jgi:DNA-binding GntR family transcriptional regulator
MTVEPAHARSPAKSTARAPRYAQIAGRLIDDIRRGRYRPGALIPTEAALAGRFAVSRITVRAAMRELERRGLVSRRAGVGTRVEDASATARYVHAAHSIEDLIQFTADLRFRVLESRALRADAGLAVRLDCAPGERLVLVRGLRVGADGTAVGLSVHYLPAAARSVVRALDGLQGSIAAFLATRLGEEIAEVSQTIEPALLGAAEARLLAAKPRSAALATRRWYRTGDGRTLLTAESLFPQGRYLYSVRLRREPSPAYAPIGGRRR